MLVITGDVDELFTPDYYRQNMQGPLGARGKGGVDLKWTRLRKGDHALSRYLLQE